MEIKVNKEIRAYRESVFFGLNLRQFLCSLGAVGAAVAVYFVGNPIFGQETVSWLCIISALPLAAMGFFNYNGMTAEQFAWAFIKSEFLRAGRRVYKSENIYLEILNTMQSNKK